MSASAGVVRALPPSVRRRLRRLFPYQPWKPPAADGALSRLRNGATQFLVDGLCQSSEWALRQRLTWGGGVFPPRPPRRLWINTTLKSPAEVTAAIAEVRACGLPPNGDAPKNWDAITALGLVLRRTSPAARVLDAGAPLYSVVLPWLYMFGYTRLWGIDLTFDRPLRRGPIRYERGDLTRTRFPDQSFDAVTCLSVIEHGVPVEPYLAEMARLLRPGGLLVTSTDYWVDPVDTRGQAAFGVPIKVFSRKAMEAFLDAAALRGFRPIQPVDLECGEKVVRWEPYGLEYTFVTVALERAG